MQCIKQGLMIDTNSSMALENGRHFVTPPLVRSEKQVQKFHADETSLPRSG